MASRSVCPACPRLSWQRATPLTSRPPPALAACRDLWWGWHRAWQHTPGLAACWASPVRLQPWPCRWGDSLEQLLGGAPPCGEHAPLGCLPPVCRKPTTTTRAIDSPQLGAPFLRPAPLPAVATICAMENCVLPPRGCVQASCRSRPRLWWRPTRPGLRALPWRQRTAGRWSRRGGGQKAAASRQRRQLQQLRRRRASGNARATFEHARPASSRALQPTVCRQIPVRCNNL